MPGRAEQEHSNTTKLPAIWFVDSSLLKRRPHT
jgi:hypothetical protein